MKNLINKSKWLITCAIATLCFASLSANAESVSDLFRHPGDPVGGNPKGKVTVVEFFDYQCSHCVEMAGTLANIMSNDPNVRVVFKDFPIRGPMSEYAARAAIAANLQGKYVALNHAMLTTNQPLSEDSIMDMAKELGINTAKLKKDMYSRGVSNVISNTNRIAQRLNINGTPAFFVGRTDATDSSDVSFVLGSMSQSQLQDLIKKAS